MDIDGQLVSYDNRRLLAAQNADLESIEVNVVDPDSPHPDSTTGKTWREKLQERLRHKKNKKAGGIVPDTCLKTKPIVCQ